MTPRSRLRHGRNALLLAGATVTLAGSAAAAHASPAAAATSLPCDIYAAGGNACTTS
jgi:non-reducing end alpha-L-arabinofuranosidase